MEELDGLNRILEVCAERLEELAARILDRDLFMDLREHPDLEYLDMQLEGFYGLDTV